MTLNGCRNSWVRFSKADPGTSTLHGMEDSPCTWRETVVGLWGKMFFMSAQRKPAGLLLAEKTEFLGRLIFTLIGCAVNILHEYFFRLLRSAPKPESF